MRESYAHLIEKTKTKNEEGLLLGREGFLGSPWWRFWKSPTDIKRSIWRKTLFNFLEEGSRDRKKKGDNPMEVSLIGRLKCESMFCKMMYLITDFQIWHTDDSETGVHTEFLLFFPKCNPIRQGSNMFILLMKNKNQSGHFLQRDRNEWRWGASTLGLCVWFTRSLLPHSTLINKRTTLKRQRHCNGGGNPSLGVLRRARCGLEREALGEDTCQKPGWGWGEKLLWPDMLQSLERWVWGAEKAWFRFRLIPLALSFFCSLFPSAFAKREQL